MLRFMFAVETYNFKSQFIQTIEPCVIFKFRIKGDYKRIYYYKIVIPSNHIYIYIYNGVYYMICILVYVVFPSCYCPFCEMNT